MVGGFPPSPSASGRPFLGLPKSTHKHRVLAYVIMDSVHLCIYIHPYIHTYQSSSEPFKIYVIKITSAALVSLLVYAYF